MMDVDPILTALARSLGANALAWFFAAFAVLLAATGVLVSILRRHARTRRARRAAALPVLAPRFGLGFVVIVAAAALFAAIAGEIGAGEELGRLDQVLSAAVGKSTSPRALALFGWVTRLGDPATLTALCVIVAIALVACGKRPLAAAWVLAIAGNAVLNVTLKGVFERVRPVHDNGLPLADGWSFPSGHSSGALVSYGMLAYVVIRAVPAAWPLPVVLLAVALAFATGCSRVFLQMHYATDVIAGFASGAAWLAICIVSIEATRLPRRA